jgi:hypothetical protein
MASSISGVGSNPYLFHIMPVGSHQPPLTQPGASPSDTLAAGGDFLSLVQMRLATQNQRIAE